VLRLDQAGMSDGEAESAIDAEGHRIKEPSTTAGLPKPPPACSQLNAGDVAQVPWAQGRRPHGTPRFSPPCSLRHFGRTGWCSLSLGAWLPSAAPDHRPTRLVAVVAAFFLANDGARAIGAISTVRGGAGASHGVVDQCRPNPQHRKGRVDLSCCAYTRARGERGDADGPAQRREPPRRQLVRSTSRPSSIPF
jgi:hypothetical protein